MGCDPRERHASTRLTLSINVRLLYTSFCATAINTVTSQVRSMSVGLHTHSHAENITHMFRKKPGSPSLPSTLSKIEELPRLRGEKLKVKRLTRERNRALGLDQRRYWDAKAAAIESAVARQDQHTVFMELRTCKLGLNNQPTTVQADYGTRLTNIKDCLCRWKDHVNDLLNKPCDATDTELQRGAEQATPDADSHTDPVVK